MERPVPEEKKPQQHYTEWTDIPKDESPQAVYDKSRHVKRKFLERYEAYKDQKETMPVAQATEILGHVLRCKECQNTQRQIRGELPEGSLPF